jgi:hypothetical protein
MKRTKSMIYRESDESRELFLYAINDGNLYRNTTKYVLDNLEKKIKKGTYDREKAVDAWYNVATKASDNYKKDFGYSFGVTDRFTVAVDMAEYYEEQILFYDL